MGVVDLNIGGTTGIADQRLAVIQSGMGVTVESGSVYHGGVQRSLDSNELFTATADATYPTHVHGFLVVEVSSGDLILFVDEVVDDGIEDTFDLDGSPDYTYLDRIFLFTVPPGVTDLDGVTITRYVVDPDLVV